jgi:hypothetical protein
MLKEEKNQKIRHCSIEADSWYDTGDMLPMAVTLPTWDLSDYDEYVQEEMTPFVRRYCKNCYFVRVSPKSMICVLTLANGFDVRGESGVIDASKYNNKIGAKYALHNAVGKASTLIAYMEQQKMCEGLEFASDTPKPI